MFFYDHPDCNGTLTAPKGEEDRVEALPVTRGLMGVCPVVRSYWVPSLDELNQLRSGEFCIAFTIVGQTHSPIRMDVVPSLIHVYREKQLLVNAPAANDQANPS